MKLRFTGMLVAALMSIWALPGCGGGDESGGEAANNSNAQPSSRGIVDDSGRPASGAAGGGGTMTELAEILSSADAGISLPGFSSRTIVEDVKEYNPGRMRFDAFALLPAEKSFDRKQEAARLVGDLGGGFGLIYQAPPEPPDPESVVEPQPYRRLTGVLLGEGVMAIIEWEDGKTYMIRPGQQVGNSEWICVSIDTEKAILKRPGNKLPRQIYVRLESRPANMGARGGGGGNPGGGGFGDPPPGQSGSGTAGERNPDN